MTHEQKNGHVPESSEDLKHVIAVGSLLKTFGGWIFGLITIVVSVIFWIQAEGSDKYYPKLSGENLEKQLIRLEQKLENLESGNREVIRLLGRLEAQAEKDN